MEGRKDYGKRKRGSDQAINYEVESTIITNSSTIDTGRNEEHEDASELEEREEIVQSGVIESSTEEVGEGETVRRALSFDPPTRLIQKEGQEEGIKRERPKRDGPEVIKGAKLLQRKRPMQKLMKRKTIKEGAKTKWTQ